MKNSFLVLALLALTSCTGENLVLSKDQGSKELSSFHVTPSVDGHSTLAPADVQKVSPGETASFTQTVNSGYILGAVGGTCPAGSWSGKTYTTGAITSDCNVSFTSAAVYVVTPSFDGNSTLTPNSNQVVNPGETVSFTQSTNAGLVRAPVTGTCPAGSWDGITYTTGAITADCSIAFSSQAATALVVGTTSFSHVSTSSITVDWTASTDSDAANTLEYKVVRSPTAITTVGAVDAITSGSGLVMDWTRAKLSKTLTGLTAGDFAFYTVAVRTSTGAKNIYVSRSRVAGPMLYISTVNLAANFGGVVTGDNICNTQKPANVDTAATKSAVIVDGVLRRSCSTPNCSGGPSENLNWPMQPLTTYYNKKGEIISTTSGAGIFTTALTHTIDEMGYMTATGLSYDWTPGTNTCNGWTAVSSDFVPLGDSNQTNLVNFLYGNGSICSNFNQFDVRLLCVEH